MKKLLIALFLTAAFVDGSTSAQVPTQEQIQAADVNDSGLNENRSQDPQQVVLSYYQALNSGDFKSAWKLLPLSLQENKKIHPKGYESFKKWFQEIIPIRVQDISILSKGNDTRILFAQVQFSINSKKQSSILEYNLKKEQEVWSIQSMKKGNNSFNQKITSDSNQEKTNLDDTKVAPLDVPQIVYQCGLVGDVTFSKADITGVYQIYGNPSEWCLIDKKSKIIIDKGVAECNGFLDADFSPSNKELIFFMSGHHGGGNFIRFEDISSNKRIQQIDEGQNKIVGEYTYYLQNAEGSNDPLFKGDLNVLRNGKSKMAIHFDPKNVNKDNLDFQKNDSFRNAGASKQLILFSNNKYFLQLKSGNLIIYNIDKCQKIALIAADDFLCENEEKKVVVIKSSCATAYNFENGKKLWDFSLGSNEATIALKRNILYIYNEKVLTAIDILNHKNIWESRLDFDDRFLSKKSVKIKISPNGRYISISGGGQLGTSYLLDSLNGKTLWNSQSSGVTAFSIDSENLAYSVHAGYTDICCNILKISDLTICKQYSEEICAPTYGFSEIFFDKSNNLLFNVSAFDFIRKVCPQFPVPNNPTFSGRSDLICNVQNHYRNLSFDEDLNFIAAQDADGFANIWKTHTRDLIVSVVLDDEGNPLFITASGFYLGSGRSFKYVGFRYNSRGYPLEQFDLRLNRPDIVLERLGAPNEAIEAAKSLREKRLKRMGVTEEMLQPDFHLPELQIVGDVPATTVKDQLDLQVKATDDKYPLDRLRVYVNNVPVNGRDGELLRDQKTQSLEKTIPIKLASGRNKIQVSVLNSAGAESLYANAEVTCTAERPKPKLYAVALGVSQYDRPEWCLKYAAKDATDLINKIKEKAANSYSEVKPLLLTDKDVTKESKSKIKEFLSGATIDDTVLIFMAGHGILDDKYDYYFGTTDIDPTKPSERGMPYEAIDTILAEVPSLKKALLMDTCHAGELDDDEKKELAASDGSTTPAAIPAASTNSSPLAGKVAMRSIGTRGMSVRAVQGAKGKSDWYEKLQDMFVDLRRGSGDTVISSSQGAEYAFESSEQSNGLFTYALMEALDGKATPNKDGQITISTVGDYVKKRVQDLTKGKQNPNLRGVNLEEDFTLSSAK